MRVMRGSQRFVTAADGIRTASCFSFGAHFDPSNIGHGPLLACNDEVLAPGAGFAPHRHADVEIVTWVLSGSLVHQDSTGRSGVLHPGLAQRMSAGTGILHSERNDAYAVEPDRPREPVHFVQMWVVPDEPGTVPGYEQREIADELLAGELVPVASGLPSHAGVAAIRVGNRHAALHAARLAPGQRVQLPDAPYLHLFVPRGSVALEDAGALSTGDAVRCTAIGGQRVTALEPAEVLVWEMHAGLQR